MHSYTNILGGRTFSICYSEVTGVKDTLGNVIENNHPAKAWLKRSLVGLTEVKSINVGTFFYLFAKNWKT